jgi:bifunctional DNA-binding transcriptional regulator/antitoxin component of YhaV-PrlF toxin-antitoxin module
MTIGTLDAKNRLRIPREISKALGLNPGDPVAYTLIDGEIRIRKVVRPLCQLGTCRARGGLRLRRSFRALPDT